VYKVWSGLATFGTRVVECVHSYWRVIRKQETIQRLNHSIYTNDAITFFILKEKHFADSYRRWINYATYLTFQIFKIVYYRIGSVKVSVLALTAVDRGIEPLSGQTKDYKIGICCFSAKHATLRRKTRSQDICSEWGDMSIHGMLFQWSSTIKIQLSVLI
jgi:hypothetical protein